MGVPENSELLLLSLAAFSVSSLPSSLAISTTRAWLSFCCLSSSDLISFFLHW
jgi:hypothetical protein